MRTTIRIRLFATTVLVAAIVAGNNFEVNAQQRDSRNNKKEVRKESLNNNRSYNKGYDHSRNDRSDREIRSYSDVRRNQAPKQNDTYRNRENEHRDYDRNRSRNNRSYNNWDKYKKPVYHKEYKGNYGRAEHRDIYVHPKYGRTYRKFYSNPYVFRHNHGRYYYYDGHFCDYRPGIGYVIVDIPYMTVFPELPFRCTRVRLPGNIYYQYGNLYFEALPYGYRLVPSPIRVHISARF